MSPFPRETELRQGLRCSWRERLAPSIFVSPDYDNTYGVQVGAGASFRVQKHVALTANARRAVISGFEPYLGDFRIISFGLRLQ